MKAKVKLTDTYTGASLNLIVELMNTEADRYEFSFQNLSDRQHAKIRRYFGKINAYYTRPEVLKIYHK